MDTFYGTRPAHEHRQQHRSSSAVGHQQVSGVHHSTATTRSPQRLKVTESAKNRYAGFFNERRSNAPKFPTASRFKEHTLREEDNTTPGPAAYNTARSSIRKTVGVSIPRAGRPTSPQQQRLAAAEDTPGPGAYNVALLTSTFRPGARPVHAAVIPRASRGPAMSQTLDAAETPGPGAYNTVISSFAKATTRASTPRGRTSMSQQVSRSTSATGRRTTHSYVDPMGLAPTLVHEEAAETPGPGAYRTGNAARVIEKHAPVAVFPRASRFDDRHLFGRRIDEDGPGIAAYAPRVVDRKAWIKNGGRGVGTIPRAARFSGGGPKSARDGDSAPGPGAYTPLWGLVR